MNKEIINIDKERFGRYGHVLEFSTCRDDDPSFEVICSYPAVGWRLALYQVRSRTAERLEKHVLSAESFEPLSGSGLLIVAEEDRPDEFEVFLLDKPVCLNPGIWHQLISLSAECRVKITENEQVSSEFHILSEPLAAVVNGG